ncbi:MAG: tRNA guanosine(34) transglycosylase Tgt [Tepidisphaeraceae bacterium]
MTGSNPKPVRYELIRQDRATAARLGRVWTPHGIFDTPAFMPVGTQGSIKGVLPDHVKETGTQIVLANTYHLMLRPGEQAVAELGGLHRFMGWDGPILTDSGGFQVFSLSDLNEITDAGVKFKSHVDGSEVFLDARRSMQVQNDLGGDIVMAFDECPPAAAAPAAHRQAVDRTLRWAAQCLAAHARPADQGLFGIVQGGVDLSLRHQCARELAAMGFDGYAIGGLAVGEGFDAMKTVLRQIAPALPAEKPRYLMGVGYPRDIVTAVSAGIDMFDCVLPTRNGRNAYAFTAQGPLRLRNSGYQRDSSPIEQGCDCYACAHFTRGAIRHFFFSGEMLGPVLVSVHNMRFYQRLMADVRRSIGEGNFGSFARGDPRCLLGPSGEAEDNSGEADAEE